MLKIIYSDVFLQHNTGPYHPENAGRLISVVQALEAAQWSSELAWQQPTSVQTRPVLPLILSIHNAKYVEAIDQLASRGGGNIDQDTPVSAATFHVAQLAVSAWLDGVDAVLGEQHPAFVLARPPGHHATPNYGMGFCIFSNAAIAAHYALRQPGVERVAILDWDVHHGNGTQACIEQNPALSYCSLHQAPFYPGTGQPQETGCCNNVLNLPIPAGSTIDTYIRLFEQNVLPFLNSAQPDLLIVSAGYDANHADPLAEIALQPSDYSRLTQYCLQVTNQIVFGLEGGYDYGTLSNSVLATLQTCLSTG